MGKIKVLVVDDSALIRALLSEIINQDKRMEVVATARDPYEARELIKQWNPDVLTLDIEMPKMTGTAFLKNLMRLRPMPVVMISTLTQEGAPATLEALELGAVDFLGKPQGQADKALLEFGAEIANKIYWASRARVQIQTPDKVKVDSKPSARVLALPSGKPVADFICAIGASTGGTEAIKSVLQVLPGNGPPLVMTQHIPDVFSTSFARRLDSLCAMTVLEAQHNQFIEAGCAYLAPGHSHLRIVRVGNRYQCKLEKSQPVNRHMPSVEVMFDSVREAAGVKALGVLLTGMGADGAQALLRMHQAGCATIAQDEASSVVWGMPGAAVRMGAADQVLPLAKIPHAVLRSAFR